MSREFAAYAADQMSAAGSVRLRPMFGAYTLYLNGKVMGIVGDGAVYIKRTAAGEAVWPDLPLQAPYEGAKPHFLLESLEDRELLARFLLATWEEVPLPKPRKKTRLFPESFT